jgi:GntR family transcriptional regulator
MRVLTALALPPGADLVQLSRLRATHGTLSVIETVYLSLQRCPGIDVRHEAEPLYGTLAREYGIVPARATLFGEAVICSSVEAQRLGVHARRPVIRLTQTTFEHDGRPFEYVESLLATLDRHMTFLEEGQHCPTDHAPEQSW